MECQDCEETPLDNGQRTLAGHECKDQPMRAGSRDRLQLRLQQNPNAWLRALEVHSDPLGRVRHCPLLQATRPVTWESDCQICALQIIATAHGSYTGTSFRSVQYGSRHIPASLTGLPGLANPRIPSCQGYFEVSLYSLPCYKFCPNQLERLFFNWLPLLGWLR